MSLVKHLMVALAGFALPAIAQSPAPNPHALSLGDAARLAAMHSGAAEAARLRADQADARVRQKRADLMPSLSANAVEMGRTFNVATFGFDFPTPAGQQPLFDPNGQVLDPVHTLDIRARLSVPLYDAGATARVRAARAEATASDADADAIAGQAATVAALAYVRALRADAQVAARTADSALAEDLVRIARDQLQAGTGIALDVTRALSQRAAGHAQLIAARADRGRARLDLLRALGLPADSVVTLTDSLGNLATPDSLLDEPAAVARAFRSRPDLRALDVQIVSADRQIAATHAERLPAISAFGDQGTVGKNGGSMLNTYSWGVQLSYPIFDGFRRESNGQEERLIRKEIEVRRQDLARGAVIEIRQAILDLNSAREGVGAAREHLGFAEQELAQSADRFRAGVAGNADVITSSLSLTSARTLLNDALASYQLSRVALARAQGIVTALP